MTATDSRMIIEHVPIDSITPYDANPRRNDAAVDAVARSIEEFGFRQPIVVDSESVIIAGHTRWKAAKKLGMPTVPVHVADLSPEKAKAYRIADNSIADLSTFEPDLLRVELEQLKALDLDLSILGWSPEQLVELTAPPGNLGLIDPDEVPAPPDAATTQPGDLWILGQHRLLCGDSANAADVDRLMDGATAAMTNTDPPYNVRVEPRSNNAIAAGLSSFSAPQTHHQKFDVKRHPEKSKGTTKKMRAKDRPLANDFVSDEDFGVMLRAWFGNIARVMIPGGAFYCWGGYSNFGNYPPALKESGLYFSQGIIWDKQHPVLTRKDFMGAFEVCYYGWKEGAGHRFFGPNNISDLWHVKKIPPGQMEHLTCKPVELAARAIAYSSKPGENVLDLFAGSGSTLIAAEQQGRRAYVMELDPLYCDLVCDRYQRFTGKPAVRERTGDSPLPMKPREECMR